MCDALGISIIGINTVPTQIRHVRCAYLKAVFLSLMHTAHPVVCDPPICTATPTPDEMNVSKRVLLKTSDSDEPLKIDYNLIVAASGTLKDLLEEMPLEEGEQDVGPIPLPNISASVLGNVLKFLELQQQHPDERVAELSETERRALPMSQQNEDFFGAIEFNAAFQLILAANYLNCKDLLEASTKWMAMKIQPLNPEQIKELFGFHGEFTPEQIAQAKKDHPWLADTTA